MTSAEVKEDIRNTYNYIRANESCILSQKHSLMRLDVTYWWSDSQGYQFL